MPVLRETLVASKHVVLGPIKVYRDGARRQANVHRIPFDTMTSVPEMECVPG